MWFDGMRTAPPPPHTHTVLLSSVILSLSLAIGISLSGEMVPLKPVALANMPSTLVTLPTSQAVPPLTPPLSSVLAFFWGVL